MSVSTQPVWITEAGSLGVVAENQFNQWILETAQAESETVFYRVIAGDLPAGVYLSTTNNVTTLSGIPQTTYTAGQDVLVSGADVTFKFAIRAYTTINNQSTGTVKRLSDRTFTITVAGQSVPVWITPAGSIGSYYDGLLLNPGIQLQYIDENIVPGVTPVTLVSGQLPPGLSVSGTGLISGLIQPNPVLATINGFSRDGQKFDQYPFDFPINSPAFTYEFTLKVSDGRTSSLRTFSLYIASTSSFSADAETVTLGDAIRIDTITGTGTSTIITFPTQTTVPFTVNDLLKIEGVSDAFNGFYKVLSAGHSSVSCDNTAVGTYASVGLVSPVISTAPMSADNSLLKASISSDDAPIVTNPEGSIGTVRNDNFFAYQFTGYDINNYPLGFEISTPEDWPEGLHLDPNTGWLSGYIPDLGLTELTFDFTVRVYLIDDPYVISNPFSYSLTFIGAISSNVTWLTPSDLGTISNGGTSTFYVEAVSTSGLSLQYKLLSGSDSNLPQGLTLLPSGNIVGRVSFDTFKLYDIIDSVKVYTTIDDGLTTFDLKHTFTVTAYSADNYVNVSKQFSITVLNTYDVPYDNLYIQCMPPQQDRELIRSLLTDTSIFPPSLLYRNDDPNFGLAHNVVYNHAYGLTATTLETYVTSLQLNHYWKNLVLGSIKTARALDDLGNVIYEVVYSEVVDTLVNNEGVGADKQVVLPYPIDANTSSEIDVVYPNALEDMRDQVIDVVGQESNVLPRWMLSKQADGRVLGFTPAWVIAYTQPGKSGQIAYNIQTQFGTQLNKVDFQADRYELDNALSYNWDPFTNSWVVLPGGTPPAATTFDINYHYDISIADGGTGFRVGDVITIPGTEVGGTAPENNVNIIVNTVDGSGAILSVFSNGNANLLAADTFYDNANGTGGTGTGDLWDVTVVPGVATPFDYGSLQFVAPSNINTNTQAYDRYLMYPKRNILGGVETVGPQGVLWTNTDANAVTWLNDSNTRIVWLEENP